MGAAALTLEVINVDVFFGVVTLFQAAEKVLAVYRFRQFLGLERRRKTQIGAIPGALPVLIGWSASGTTLDLRAAGLFLVVFVWQFPHFMAIAWIYRKQYEAAGMKMLTVVDPTGRWAGIQAILAALVLIPVSVVPVLSVPGLGGFVYAVVACVLGFLQLGCAIAFFTRQGETTARRLLWASLVYLPSLLLLLTIVPWL